MEQVNQNIYASYGIWHHSTQNDYLTHSFNDNDDDFFSSSHSKFSSLCCIFVIEIGNIRGCVVCERFSIKILWYTVYIWHDLWLYVWQLVNKLAQSFEYTLCSMCIVYYTVYSLWMFCSRWGIDSVKSITHQCFYHFVYFYHSKSYYFTYFRHFIVFDQFIDWIDRFVNLLLNSRQT